MGLGFTPISSIGASPWWETLAKGGSWAQPLFGFYLTRYIRPLYEVNGFVHFYATDTGTIPLLVKTNPAVLWT